ncbi:hypothetical protein ES705_31693 [subsurface metagenome]
MNLKNDYKNDSIKKKLKKEEEIQMKTLIDLVRIIRRKGPQGEKIEEIKTILENNNYALKKMPIIEKKKKPKLRTDINFEKPFNNHKGQYTGKKLQAINEKKICRALFNDFGEVSDGLKVFENDTEKFRMKVMDYEIPLEKRRDKSMLISRKQLGIGDIDLVGKANEIWYIVECKYGADKMKLLESVFQSYTYYRMVMESNINCQHIIPAIAFFLFNKNNEIEKIKRSLEKLKSEINIDELIKNYRIELYYIYFNTKKLELIWERNGLRCPHFTDKMKKEIKLEKIVFP